MAFALAAALALPATGAGADCLAPLAASPNWSCRAQLSSGAAVEFCLEHTNSFGVASAPQARTFKTTSTGPYVQECMCGAKGRAAFGADADYLCLDRATDTVVTGRISKRRITAETYNASANVLGSAVCTPDPGCDVRTVLDGDLQGVAGDATLGAGTEEEHADAFGGGDVDVAYLGGGCAGFATEAPTFAFDVDAEVPGTLAMLYDPNGEQGNEAAGIVVMSPSGSVSCHATEVSGLALQRGRWAMWVTVAAPGATIEGRIEGRYQP